MRALVAVAILAAAFLSAGQALAQSSRADQLQQQLDAVRSAQQELNAAANSRHRAETFVPVDSWGRPHPSSVDQGMIEFYRGAEESARMRLDDTLGR